MGGVFFPLEFKECHSTHNPDQQIQLDGTFFSYTARHTSKIKPEFDSLSTYACA